MLFCPERKHSEMSQIQVTPHQHAQTQTKPGRIMPTSLAKYRKYKYPWYSHHFATLVAKKEIGHSRIGIFTVSLVHSLENIQNTFPLKSINWLINVQIQHSCVSLGRLQHEHFEHLCQLAVCLIDLQSQRSHSKHLHCQHQSLACADRLHFYDLAPQ